MLKRLLIFFLAVPVFAQVGGISRSTTPSSGDYGFWNRTNATIKPKTTTDTVFVNYLKSTGYVSLTSAIGTAADVWIRRVNPGRVVFGTTATDSAGILSLGRIFGYGKSQFDSLHIVGNAYVMGNVGIGTTEPDDALHIKQGTNSGIRLENPTVTTGRTVLIRNLNAGDFDIFDVTGGGDIFRYFGATGNIQINSPASANSGIYYEGATGNVGAGTVTPRHKNSSAVSATNLNALNWYNSDRNLNVSTAAQERDTSSIAGWFSGAQTPTFAIVNAVGATQFKSDSLGLTWGGGTTVKKILSATAAYNFGSIAAQTDSVTTITLTGAVAGDDVSVGVSAAMEAGLVVWGECTTNDQVRVHATNISAGAIDPANRTYRVTTRGF